MKSDTLKVIACILNILKDSSQSKDILTLIGKIADTLAVYLNESERDPQSYTFALKVANKGKATMIEPSTF